MSVSCILRTTYLGSDTAVGVDDQLNRRYSARHHTRMILAMDPGRQLVGELYPGIHQLQCIALDHAMVPWTDTVPIATGLFQMTALYQVQGMVI